MNLDTLENVLLALLVADAVALAVLVLIQQGKGADVGAAFGSGSANTMFGSAGSTSFLAKLTSWLAVGFFAIAFGLAYTAKERAGSLADLGIPQVVAPLSDGATDASDTPSDLPQIDAATAPQADDAVIPDLEEATESLSAGDSDIPELTGEAESVDSDIPDV